MSPKRKSNGFCAYERDILRNIRYTLKVSQKQISFTEEFKQIFWEQYQTGECIIDIFYQRRCPWTPPPFS